MRERYIAIDAGKFATKFAVYIPETETARKQKFRTKISAGDLRDDNIEKGTYLIEYEGKTYKVGNGATQEAKLELTKMGIEHRVCALTAIALVAEEGDVFHVAMGCPIMEYQNVNIREQYKEALLPSGEVSVKMKLGSDEEVITKTFTILSKVIYAESTGILYIDPMRFSGGTTGVIDIGGGTAIGNISENFEPNPLLSVTTELGGNVLISELSQELSARFGRVDMNLAAKLIKMDKDHRCLVHATKKDMEKESKEVIASFIKSYVNKIRRACDTKSWSLDFIDLVFTGGTSEILAPELRECFGDNIYIPDHSEFTNAVGFLKKLVSRKLSISIDTDNEFDDVSSKK